MKYRCKVSYPGVDKGTVFYPIENEYGEIIYSTVPIKGGTNLHLLRDWEVTNPDFFELFDLTSDEEDEAARRYMWVPEKGSNVFRINSSLIVVGQNWSGLSYDWFYFRCGMIFRTKSEAEQAAKLMMQDYVRI